MSKAPLVMGGLVGGGVFALLAAGLVFYATTAAFGQADAVVYNDGDAPIAVKVDGVVVSEVPPRTIGTVPVPQGAHVVTTGADYPVTVDGFTTILVPTSASQCFAEADVSHLYELSPRQTPLVVRTWTGEAAIAISEHTEFLRSSLPDQVRMQYAPMLVVPVPCADLSLESAQAYVVANEARLF